LLAYAPSRKQSWQVFARKFEATWDWIVAEEDKNLSPEARKLKKRYLEVVEAVDPIV
jgi:hypothetical protein